MKYCRAFPCSNIALPGSAYCTEHAPARAPKQADAFYVSVAWRRFRDWFIARHPLCQQCEAEGRLTASRIVDHVIELKDGGAPLSEDNAMSLCSKCHAIKTALSKNYRQSDGNNRTGSQKQS
jgi:5-methylcytosine-specific restriction protein A